MGSDKVVAQLEELLQLSAEATGSVVCARAEHVNEVRLVDLVHDVDILGGELSAKLSQSSHS
jgi:hypothetical protein